MRLQADGRQCDRDREHHDGSAEERSDAGGMRCRYGPELWQFCRSKAVPAVDKKRPAGAENGDIRLDRVNRESAEQ